MKTRIISAFIFSFLLLSSCHEKKAEATTDQAAVQYDKSYTADYNKKSEYSTADSTGMEASSSAARVDPDNNRKFIRTADLRFRVADARKSTYDIEDVIGRNGGYVTSTELRAENLYSRNITVSSDSMVVLTTYNLINIMDFRVPVMQLDSTLRQIGRQAEFIDYRIIKADDVTMQLFQNKLNEERLKKQNRRSQRTQQIRPGDISEATDAEQRLIDQENQIDQNILAQAGMQHDMAYSTVRLYFYQQETTQKELVAIPENIGRYEAGFFSQVLNKIDSGWQIGKAILLFLLNGWFFIAIGIGGWMIYKIIVKKKSK